MRCATPLSFLLSSTGKASPRAAASVLAALVLLSILHSAYGDESLLQRYLGEKVTSREGLAPYTGEHAYKMVVGPKRQEAYRLNYEQLGINYGDNVDFQLRQEQVILSPQTAEFLYSEFTPTEIRYKKGSRPSLEKAVDRVTAGCKTDREKMLALMRFCRDLYKKRKGIPFTNYIYGGTEEQLIEKGEELCECLGRLMVALCEIAGIPGRIVMHNIGGHITAEILVDGKWAYIDPRVGLYFIKPDGTLASTWELVRNPRLLDDQPDSVKADLSPRWNWEERIWKCRHKYFTANEINGFQNYSLADADRYNYAQKTYKQASDDGLFVINKDYCRVINEVFDLKRDGFQFDWRHAPLRNIPLAYRHDGFSPFYVADVPLTRKQLEKQYVDPFANSNVDILVWGLGPGSVFCFDTKVGQIFGAPLNEKQWTMLRLGDRRAYENVTGLIKAGAGPLKIAVERGHTLGKQVIARLEMNHEYGPASESNWNWVGFVGDFNKRHPEYRVAGSVRLDFKHKAVRDFKIAILREAAEIGADGISMDFAVYPPHFTRPDKEIMNQFVRDVRAMLDEVGAAQNRQIELMIRIPAIRPEQIGLDWKTWMREGLIDYLVPTQYRVFDIDVDEFVAMGNRTGVEVWPTLFFSLSIVNTDPQPGDEKKGIRRYSKPKTPEMFYAQAMLFHRAGAGGLQLGFSEDQWNHCPWLNDLGDVAKMEFADKHYMVNSAPQKTAEFPVGDGKPIEKTVSLRIADDVAKARSKGYDVTAELVFFFASPLAEGATLDVRVNDAPATGIQAKVSDVTPKKNKPSTANRPFISDADWWTKGERRLSIRADDLQLGENTISLTYTPPAENPKPFVIKWIDVIVRYQEKK